MLRKLRTNKGITSTFVAQNLKISRDRLRRIEENKVMLPVEFLPYLSKLYGVTCKQIMDWRVLEWEKQKENL